MAEENTCPVPTGALLIIGGAEAKEDASKKDGNASSIGMEVLSCFMQLLDSEQPIIEVITSASSDDPVDSFNNYEKSFKELGAYVVNHIHHDNRNDIVFADIEARLKSTHGVFLTGGDQLKLTSVYGGTDLLLLLKER